jgi:hypothetical protein
MSTTVRIPWIRGNDNEAYWDEICIWAIERFGLPGDRFQTHAYIYYMDFVFTSNKDALVMALMWNAKIVPDEELTVEHVGKFI